MMMGTSVMTMMAQEQQTEVLMPGERPKPTKYVAVEEQKELCSSRVSHYRWTDMDLLP